MFPDYLADLHADFCRLASQELTALTEDQRRSLAYFHVDVEMRAARENGGFPRDRISRWIRQAQEVDDFIDAHGRIPRRNYRHPLETTSPTEKRLAIWLEEQLRPAGRGRQCSYQRRRINALPGSDYRTRDERWWATLAAYEQFLAVHHRAPAARAGAEEGQLALWATRQRSAYRAGSLRQDRLRALQDLTIWTWGRGHTKV